MICAAASFGACCRSCVRCVQQPPIFSSCVHCFHGDVQWRRAVSAALGAYGAWKRGTAGVLACASAWHLRRARTGSSVVRLDLARVCGPSGGACGQQTLVKAAPPPMACCPGCRSRSCSECWRRRRRWSAWWAAVPSGGDVLTLPRSFPIETPAKVGRGTAD